MGPPDNFFPACAAPGPSASPAAATESATRRSTRARSEDASDADLAMDRSRRAVRRATRGWTQRSARMMVVIFMDSPREFRTRSRGVAPARCGGAIGELGSGGWIARAKREAESSGSSERARFVGCSVRRDWETRAIDYPRARLFVASSGSSSSPSRFRAAGCEPPTRPSSEAELCALLMVPRSRLSFRRSSS